MRGVALIFATVFAAAALHAAAGSSAPRQATVVDRTYLCTNTELAGVRKLSANGRRGFREGGSWKWTGAVHVVNRGAEPVRVPPDEGGFRRVSDANWSVAISAGGSEAEIELVTRGCATSRRRPALSQGGLSRTEADYFGDYFECRLPRRVLVRVRGEFRDATTLRRDARQGPLQALRAQGRVTEATFVVQTEAGKPMVFGRVAASGKATFAIGAGCLTR